MKTRTIVRLLICGAFAIASPARADDASMQILNALRMTECSGQPAGIKPLKGNGKLDAAARLINDGLKAGDAFKRVGYRPLHSATVEMSGKMDDAAMKRMLLKSYCTRLVDPTIIDAGIFRDGHVVAIILAAPFLPPAAGDASKVAKEALQLVNEARSRPRKCGRKSFYAVPPLTLNATLAKAAAAHAKDMAAHGQMTHQGSDGSSPDIRVTRTGYDWKVVGENVAVGDTTAQAVVAGWLASPHHCENIMDPDFTQMAIAYAVDDRSKGSIYWAQEFGRPK
jgi:uncharacterized protein YkwD